MSTTVTYKGSTLATVNNNTKTLKTAGKYMEDDVQLTDTTSTIVVSETYDTNGGIIKTITTTGEVNLQAKTITPTTSIQTVNPDTGYDGFSQVIVNAGGIDGPIFEINVDTSTPTITCDETFEECSAYIDGLIIVNVYQNGEVVNKLVGELYMKRSSQIIYTVYSDGIPAFAISYLSSGAIEYSEPASTVRRLQVTENGDYNADYGTVWNEVNVNVSGGQPTLQSKTYNVSSAGTATVTADSGYDGLSSVAVSVPQADPRVEVGSNFFTENNIRKYRSRGEIMVSVEDGDVAGYLSDGYSKFGDWLVYDAVPSNTTITPTESAQTIGGHNYMMEGAVTVNAIPSNYVGSGITQRSSSDLTVSGATVTVPSGYYSAQASKAVASGTAGTPTATKVVDTDDASALITPSVTNTTGYITGGTKNGTAVTVSASELVSGTLSVTSNGTKDVTNYASVDVNISSEAPSIESLSITPSESEQTFNASTVDGYKPVTVSAISSTYVGSGITQRDGGDITSSTPSYYNNGTYDYIRYGIGVKSGYYNSNVAKTFSTRITQVTDLPIQNATTITPSESQQTVAASQWLAGAITISPISSTYVGSGITQRDSDDLTASGATVTVPAGYYSAAASKSVASGSASAPSSISGTSASVTTGTNTLTLTKTVSVTPVVSAGYVSSGTATNSSVSLTASIPINPTVTASGATVTIPTGYYTTQTTKSVASGSATAPSSISGTAASVSTGTNTLTLTKTVSVTPNVTTAGYISSGTAGNSSVTLTASVTTKAAATITPTTTNQTIAAGTYLTGTQTIAGDADLVASNIKKDVNIFGVTGTYDPTDFIINLTQDSNNKWIPDCTFAEAEAALNSGKTLKFVAEYPAGDTYFGGYNDLDRTIAYGVVENTSTLSGTVLVDKSFIYDVANTVTQDLTSTYYTTTHATAQASDVISTKTFFNGSGYQTGTLDLTDVYIRSAAPTSSVGSDGDIYIQE